MSLTRITNIAKRVSGRAFLFGLFISISTITASTSSLAGSVEPNAEQIAAYENGTEGARIKLLIALAKQGQHELADTMLQRYPLTGKYASNRTLYIEGLILRGRKDNASAAAKFRAALADDPKLTAVRSDLAETLAEMGEDDSAKHHLKLLEADAPNEQAASNIRAFIDRIDQNRPYKFNAYLSVAPSTNINNGSSHNTVSVYHPIDQSFSEEEVYSRGKSGLGTAVGVNGSYHKKFGDHWMAVFAEGANARVYSDRSFNSISLSQSFDIRYIGNGSSVAVGLIANESIKSDLSDMPYYAYGPRISASANLTVRDIIAGTVIQENRRYRDASSLNGWARFNDFAWTHAFDAGTNTTTSLGFNRIKSGNNKLSYKTWYTGLSLYKEMPRGITANLSGQAQYSTFDVFNGAGQKFRKDTRLIGSLGLVKRDWNIFGFAPSVEYTYVKNFSNLNIYDYDSHAFDLRLTKDF
jgi:tetratricopeptide (TPR) repeat protein